jgi:hypothetical protein
MRTEIKRAAMTAWAVALALSALPLVFELATPAPAEASGTALTMAMASILPAAGQGALIVSAVGGGLFLCWLCEQLIPADAAHRRRDALALSLLAPGAALCMWIMLELAFGARFVAPAVLSGVHVLMSVCTGLFAHHLVSQIAPVSAGAKRTLS